MFNKNSLESFSILLDFLAIRSCCVKVEENLVKNQKTVWVSVKNTGTLMDIGKVEMFVDGKKVGDAVHYELGAGEEKLIPFKLAKENKQPVAFTTKYKMVSM